MLHSIQASLKKHIEQHTGLSCVWLYDGVKLPAARPIITIEAMPVNFTNLAKQRDAFRASYRFQIGVLANNSTQGSRLPHEIAQLLLLDTVPLIDTEQGGTLVGTFDAHVDRITPMPAATADSAEKHKSYIDVTVLNVFGPGI